MINLIHGELYKYKKSLALKICILITMVCAVLLAVLSNGNAVGTMNIPANSLSGLSDIFIMSVVGTLMASLIICGDFESKDMHDAISCGRRNIVVSKSIGYFIVIALLVLPYAITAFIGFITKGQFQATFSYSTYLTLMSNQSGVPVNAESIGKSIEVLLISIVLYAARLSFCIPLAFKIKKAVVVTVAGVVLGFLSDFFVNLLSKVPVLDTILEYTPFAHPIVTMDMSHGELIKILVISLSFFVFMIILTNILFKKDEIK